MTPTTCPQCGSRFESTRGNRKFCSGRCRTAAYRGRPAVAPVPDVPAALMLAPPSVDPGELVASVIAEAANCQSPAAAAQALHLARAIEDNPPAHTLASLHRALAAARQEVLRSVPVEVETDIIDLLRHRRALLQQTWADRDAGLLSAREAELRCAAIRDALALVTPARPQRVERPS